jgi:uncharacterized membrane protein YccC
MSDYRYGFVEHGRDRLPEKAHCPVHMTLPSRVSSVASYVVITIAAYLLGSHFTALFHQPALVIGGLWSVISGIIVFESTRPKVLRSAKLRVIGSFIGALVSGVYLYFFSFTVLGFAACVGVGALICHLLRLPEHIKLTGVTISVIMLVSVITNNLSPIENAALRFAESVIGAAVAIAVAYVSSLSSPE